MFHRCRSLLLPTFLLAPAPCPASAASAPVKLKDFRQLVRIGSPRFSPGGHRIAFLTYRPDFIHDRYDTTLRIIDTRDGKARVLAPSLHDIAMPRWSPDGRTLAFIAHVGTQKPQIYTVAAAVARRSCAVMRHAAWSSSRGVRTASAWPS